MPIDKDQQFELMMAGTGGQGVVLAGILLAEAAYSRFKHVVYCPNYGAARRGGETECTVVFSNSEIFSPIKLNPAAAVAMSSPCFAQLSKRVRSGGALLVDSSIVQEKNDRKDMATYYIPATKRAGELGSAVTASLLMIGAYLQLTGAFPVESMGEALQGRLSGTRAEKHLELNKKILVEGAKLMKACQLSNGGNHA